jgi:formyltetrahydrofolate deformylase
MLTATLLISSRDRRGLAAAVSDFLYRNDGNIVHADQHTDEEEGLFLQRVEWALDGFKLGRADLPEAFTQVARRFQMEWSLRFSDVRPRVALLASRQPHCLTDLLARWSIDELRAHFPLVVSNHDAHRAIAEHFGVAYHYLPIGADGREAQEARLRTLLDAERIDLVVLARYMQILSPAFVAAYRHRIINIHHSFLPAFAGARPYHQAQERGVKVIGATAHYVTEELDEGPIIEQDVTRASHRDTVEDLMRKGRDLEKIVLARAVRLHLTHRVLIYGNKTVVFD